MRKRFPIQPMDMSLSQFGCGNLQTARAIGIIRAALETKGASVLAGEVVDARKLKAEALATEARDIANALAAELA